MSAVRIRVPDARHSTPIVSTRQKPLADVPDPFQAEHAVFGGALLIVDAAELIEMPVEDRVQLIATPGDVDEPWWQSRALEWRFPHTTRRAKSPPCFTLAPGAQHNIAIRAEF